MSTLTVGDYGTAIRFTLTDATTGAAVDLSTATVLKMRVRKPLASNPSRTEDVIWDAAAYGEAVAGVVQHVTAEGEADAAGSCLVQPYVEFGPASALHATVSAITVSPRFS